MPIASENSYLILPENVNNFKTKNNLYIEMLQILISCNSFILVIYPRAYANILVIVQNIFSL